MGRRVDVIVQGFDDTSLRFDQMIQSINEIEQLLNIPFPSPQITMNRVTSLAGGFCGNNQLSYARRYRGEPFVIDNSTISMRVGEDCDDTYESIAHEVAHTWFHGNDPQDWIDEGLANAMEQQVVARLIQPGQAIYPPITYCRDYRNIAQLERGKPDQTITEKSTGFACNYSLGDGIFGALRQHHGDLEFNRLIAPIARRQINYSDYANTIVDIRHNLGGDDIALATINEWYEGQPTMRKYKHLDQVEWIFPPTIDGNYLHFSGRTEEPDMVQDLILGNDTNCPQFTVRQGTRQSKWIASLVEPLPVGWRHDEAPKVEISNYQINPATGEFHVTARINDTSITNLAELSLVVRSRVTVGADGFCMPSTIHSQTGIAIGAIPGELKVHKHQHLDAIEWTTEPTIHNDTMRFAGRALPGTVRFTYRSGYCGQLSLYYRDNLGYHYIDSIDPMLPARQYWTGHITAEVIKQRVEPDGTFEATVAIRDPSLTQYDNLLLKVATEVRVNPNTNRCERSETLSAVDI